MKIQGKTAIASAAAALFTLGVAGGAAADHHMKGEKGEKGGKAEKVQCEGVNSCKGKSACKTANHECSGLNECKGKGWVEMTPEACEKAKAALES